ncbi:MAG: site-specific DNA-methyltransferase [Sphingobacteriales bacterium]|nr:site-specific DNA-methyltransferase [Sphingobacteriales bacterium]
MSEKIICLGKEFNSEEERREYFRNELRAKLPELKKIEGFPIGEDEDIINLSDPPYYTACPNPWLNAFIDEWEQEKESIAGRKKEFYVDSPYATDVSEGKNNPVYNAHSYHTKVPHPAIMRYILYYTQPGDIVLDGFAGTGMTAVAAQMCESPDLEVKQQIEVEWTKLFSSKPTWGLRKSICSDLSPIASLLATNFSGTEDLEVFDKQSKEILQEFKLKLGDVYSVKYKKEKCEVNFILYSDVYACSNCNEDIVYWGEIFDYKTDSDFEYAKCKKCNTNNDAGKLERKFKTVYDDYLGNTIQIKKSIPVQININYKGKNILVNCSDLDENYEEKVSKLKPSKYFPIVRMPEGDEARRNDRTGITHTHHFYSPENLYAISTLYDLASKYKYTFFGFFNTSWHATIMRRYNSGGGHRPKSGTLYIPSLSSVGNVYNIYENKLSQLRRFLFATRSFKEKNRIIETVSANSLGIKSNSVDYIFTDPPFGANIMYSELNFLWENWINVLTNIRTEAIENKTQKKGKLEYQELMLQCFIEFYRVLKPDRWMTVEFSNPSAAIWNSIQTALQKAGFVIANVSALDKKQGSINAYTTPTAVKQDLVISCYKPSDKFETTFKTENSDLGVWAFVSEHLKHLPIHLQKGNNTTSIIERSSKILHDRLITFYLMRGLPIPIDSKDFQEGLRQRFVERDGMYFTAEQAAEYDEKKAKAPQFVQLSFIVTNESDAIEWLKDRLRKQAQKYQDIMPDFRIATQSLRKGDTLPELQEILNENFIQEPDGRWRTPDPNEAKDREALRTKVLLKEFNGYVTAISQPRAKKLKEVRVEALRAGFKNCWEQKDFKTIVTLGDMIPQNILLEDEQLLMYYDIAKDRV